MVTTAYIDCCCIQTLGEKGGEGWEEVQTLKVCCKEELFSTTP